SALLIRGLIIISLHAGACCPIELSPPRVAVRYGDPVSINCSTSDHLYKGMGWESPLGGTGLKPVRHLTWSVDALTRWHISPVCFLSPVPKSGRDQCSKNPDVVVYTNRSVVKEGEPVEVTCIIRRIAPIHRVIVRWYSSDTVITERRAEGSTEGLVDLLFGYNYEHFKSSSVRQQQLVKLKCEAVLDLLPEGPQLNPPSQIEELEDIEVELGSEIYLQCATRANPRPEYSWSAPTFLDVTQVNEDGVSRLLIPNVASHHTGVYTCYASNERGSVTKQVTVSVKGETHTLPRSQVSFCR
uniref:Ig-like domain-containing protein n=1 Tax=Hippocampus comes TaxID=109280 RepID=A0A3Q2Y715_HIPCM